MGTDPRIIELIVEEQDRQSGQLLTGVDFKTYLAKLTELAEITGTFIQDRCRGFVAFYCNDVESKNAFITLLLVDPRDRGLGVGRGLMLCALMLMKSRGFETCKLEVKKSNQAALCLYQSLNFRMVEDRTNSFILEVKLSQ